MRTNSEVSMEEGHSKTERSVLENSISQPRFASNLLLWLILGFFLIFILWAALTELDQTVRANGRVIASSELQTISNLEGGIVEAILVEVGEEVEDNAPLIRLDQTLLDAEYGSSRAQLNILNVRIARLEAEVQDHRPRFPETTGAVVSDQVEIERMLYRSRMADIASSLTALRARVQQSRRAVAEANATLAVRISSRNAAQSEADIIRPLVERGFEPRLSLIQADNRAASAASEVQVASAAVSRARAAVAETEANLAQARQEWRSRSAQELADAQAQRAALRRTVPALADRVRRTIVRAPLAGRVNRVLTTTVGSVIRPGDPVIEIAPTEERLIVEAMARPQDIAQIRLGQTAEVGITAYPSVVYGTLDGIVIAISPDTVDDPRTGEPFYTVRIDTEGALLDSEGNPLVIGPGMTANVSLLGEKQSILTYILTPITRLSRSALRE